MLEFVNRNSERITRSLLQENLQLILRPRKPTSTEKKISFYFALRITFATLKKQKKLTDKTSAESKIEITLRQLRSGYILPV